MGDAGCSRPFFERRRQQAQECLRLTNRLPNRQSYREPHRAMHVVDTPMKGLPCVWM
jgi:hypothetical protein